MTNEQKWCVQCGDALAAVYAIDPAPGGWGDWYCEPCALSFRPAFQIIDRLPLKPAGRVNRLPVGECEQCDAYTAADDRMAPAHAAMPGCESGRRDHCTCDRCY